MRIIIETDSESGAAPPSVSTVNQTPGALGTTDQVNAGAAPAAGTGGGAVTASAVTAVDAGQAPAPNQK
jgi:hypothetical protein